MTEETRLTPDDGLQQMDLNLHPNEASGLLTIQDEALLAAHDWELGFWVVMDEGRVEECIGVIGHRNGADISDGWEIDRFLANPLGKALGTDDCESVTSHDGWVYILGSHYGSKSGPLQPKRGFIARFREGEVKHAFENPAVDIEVYRDSFAVHRLVNDALAASDIEVMELGPETYEAMISRTIKRGVGKGKRWASLVRESDFPLNIEGAAFRHGGSTDGNLLLGLRFPTSAKGHAILVELSGIDSVFGSGEPKISVEGIWTVDAIGRDGGMAGVRDLALVRTEDGEELHLVTGNVDSNKGGSVLIQDYEKGRDTVATHFRCVLPQGRSSGNLKGEFVREFPDLPRVEGIAIVDEDRFFYVTDEDEGVHLHLTKLLADAGR